jgi:hypothetical protein
LRWRNQSDLLGQLWYKVRIFYNIFVQNYGSKFPTKSNEKNDSKYPLWYGLIAYFRLQSIPKPKNKLSSSLVYLGCELIEFVKLLFCDDALFQSFVQKF